MPLDPAKIKQLMAIKNRPKKTGGRGSKKVDTSVRTYETWFSMQSMLLHPETRESLKCENPNCVDPRHTGIMCCEVNGVYMCRYCFLDGWLAKDPAQEVLSEQ